MFVMYLEMWLTKLSFEISQVNKLVEAETRGVSAPSKRKNDLSPRYIFLVLCLISVGCLIVLMGIIGAKGKTTKE